MRWQVDSSAAVYTRFSRHSLKSKTKKMVWIACHSRRHHPDTDDTIFHFHYTPRHWMLVSKRQHSSSKSQCWHAKKSYKSFSVNSSVLLNFNDCKDWNTNQNKLNENNAQNNINSLVPFLQYSLYFIHIDWFWFWIVSVQYVLFCFWMFWNGF